MMAITTSNSISVKPVRRTLNRQQDTGELHDTVTNDPSQTSSTWQLPCRLGCVGRILQWFREMRHFGDLSIMQSWVKISPRLTKKRHILLIGHLSGLVRNVMATPGAVPANALHSLVRSKFGVGNVVAHRRYTEHAAAVGDRLATL